LRIPRSLLFLGYSAVILSVVGSSCARARSSTGYSSFRIQNPLEGLIIRSNLAPGTSPQVVAGANITPLEFGFYNCVTEDNGAVVNNCFTPQGNSISVNLLFEMPIDNEVNHNITLINYWKPTSGYTPFSCFPFSYRGTSGQADATGNAITFTQAAQQTNNSTSVNVGHPQMGMTIICWAVPSGEGISIVNWDP
jgi:hypothetical protein